LEKKREVIQKIFQKIEHLHEIKVKYIYRGDGGIGRRNGLKIKIMNTTDTPYR